MGASHSTQADTMAAAAEDVAETTQLQEANTKMAEAYSSALKEVEDVVHSMQQQKAVQRSRVEELEAELEVTKARKDYYKDHLRKRIVE
jgi:hypothetical protein